MASRKIEDLHDSVRNKARQFLSRCSEQGMHVIVTCTLRTMKEQTALYAQGREDIAAVNALRRLAGMPPIQMEANRIVTHARPGYIPCTTSGSPSTSCLWMRGNLYGTSLTLSGRE